jgi:hypothetical protein
MSKTAMTDFLDTPFGEYHEAPSTCHLEDATYDGTISKMSLRMRNGQPERDEFDHKRVSVIVNVATSTGDIPLQRTMSMTFDQSDNGVWSQFAQFIEAASGIPCGDPAQRKVTPRTVINAPIRVVTKYNSSKAKTNIEKFLRPATQRPGPTPGHGNTLPGPRRDAAPAPAPARGGTPPAAVRPAPATASAPAPTPARQERPAPAAGSGAPRSTSRPTGDRPAPTRTFRSNDEPSPGGQTRLLSIKEHDQIEPAMFDAIVTDVGGGKPFEQLSGPECAQISVKLRQYARSAA